MSELEITGIWWDPKNKERQVSGTLTFNNDNGGELTLIGTLGGIKSFMGNAVPIIHGLADNKLVTLHNAYTRSISHNSPGPSKHVFHVDIIFIDGHLSEDEMVFNKINLQLTYLPEFISKSSLSYSMHFDKSMQHLKSLSAEVKSQKPHYIGPVPDGRISASYGWSKNGVSFRSVILNEQCSLTIELNKTLHLDEIIKIYVRPLQDLVTLATDLPNAITRLEVQNPKILNRHNSKPKTLEVYKRTFADFPNSDKESLSHRDMLFTLKDLKRTKINKWISVAQYYGPAMTILFGQRYTKGVLENKLLNSVSAIEAYHRRKFKNNLSGKVAWDKRLERILRNADEKDKLFLKEKLSFANDKNLKHRLKDVLTQSGLDDDFISNQVKWNKLVRDYRNVLTHYDPKSPKEITDSEQLYLLAESLAWVLLACLMREIGFTKTEIHSLVKENQRYNQLKDAMRETLK